jgi:L-rhamnose mutarotase
MRRFGQIIKLKPEMYEEYKRLHAAVWPEILAKIAEANIRNYAIFHKNGLLFAYFEYVGDDFDADMAKIGTDPRTHAWWALTDPCQEPVEGNSKGSTEGQWWLPMEELFSLEDQLERLRKDTTAI